MLCISKISSRSVSNRGRIFTGFSRIYFSRGLLNLSMSAIRKPKNDWVRFVISMVVCFCAILLRINIKRKRFRLRIMLLFKSLICFLAILGTWTIAPTKILSKSIPMCWGIFLRSILTKRSLVRTTLVLKLRNIFAIARLMS